MERGYQTSDAIIKYQQDRIEALQQEMERKKAQAMRIIKCLRNRK